MLINTETTIMKRWCNFILIWGRGGGQVVSVLAFYSDDPSSNPAEANNFFRIIVFKKNENKQGALV